MSGIISAQYRRSGLSLGFLFFVFALWCFPGVSTAQEWATNGSNIYNTNTENVGIGITNPSNKLEVSSPYTRLKVKGTSSDAWVWADGAGNNNSGFMAGTDGTTRVLIDGAPNAHSWFNTGGNIGIGTAIPGVKLDVKGSVRVGGATSVDSHTLSFADTEGDEWYLQYAQQGTNYGLGIFEDGISTPRVYLLDGGRVGIGTTAPATELHVVGDVTVTGNIAAKYQDVAEWVPASSPISAGTIVTLDLIHSNHVIPSLDAYDTRVAGVVSATPGLLLGEAGEGKVKVATTGRVKVKVDATRKPIRVGDLLVTSDQEGMAMCSEPIDFGGIPIHRPGTILGKALESLSEGRGEILVLLTLQ